MDESPQLYYLIVPVSLGAVFGLFFGLLASWDVTVNRQYWIVGASVLFSFFGWRLSDWFIRKREQWVFFEYSTDTPVQQVETITKKYFAIYIDTNKVRYLEWYGMDDKQWQQLGLLVVNSAYSYKQEFFEQILGREKGRQVYSLVSGALNYNDTFLVVHGNGFKLTNEGNALFNNISKGDWRVLNELPNQ